MSGLGPSIRDAVITPYALAAFAITLVFALFQGWRIRGIRRDRRAHIAEHLRQEDIARRVGQPLPPIMNAGEFTRFKLNDQIARLVLAALVLGATVLVIAMLLKEGVGINCEGDDIYVDGGRVGHGEIVVELAPGPHHIQCRRGDQISYEREIDVAYGDRMAVAAPARPVALDAPGDGEALASHDIDAGLQLDAAPSDVRHRDARVGSPRDIAIDTPPDTPPDASPDARVCRGSTDFRDGNDHLTIVQQCRGAADLVGANKFRLQFHNGKHSQFRFIRDETTGNVLRLAPGIDGSQDVATSLGQHHDLSATYESGFGTFRMPNDHTAWGIDDVQPGDVIRVTWDCDASHADCN